MRALVYMLALMPLLAACAEYVVTPSGGYYRSGLNAGLPHCPPGHAKKGECIPHHCPPGLAKQGKCGVWPHDGGHHHHKK